MAFIFIHSADWQLGKAFASFPSEQQGVLTLARLEAIDRLAHVARGAGARHVLVAGDIFDHEALADDVLRRGLAKMAAQPGIVWLLLPGNHDPARPGGIWDRVHRLGCASNIVILATDAPAEIIRGVWLLPAPLKLRSAASDPTEGMSAVATPDGAIRIGLAHGSIQGFSGDGEAKAIISPARAKSAGLSYLALGDWHGAMRIDERTWYSGTPEPDRFASNRPGHALAVRIETATALPTVEQVATARFNWMLRRLSLTGAADLAPLEAEIAERGEAMGRILLRLVLEGGLPANEFAALEERLGQLEARLFHLVRDLKGVAMVTAEADLETLGQGDVRVAAEYLAALAKDPSHASRSIADLALRRLFELALNDRSRA